MDYSVHPRMYFKDQYGREYILNDFNEIDFIYSYFDILKKSNSSIHVKNNVHAIIQLNVRDIKSFFIVRGYLIKIYLSK